jgi:Thioesterase superfamily.
MKKRVLKKQNNTKDCFICGLNNEAGLQAEFYELEDGTVAALAVARFVHQSYPQRVHGGVSTALLDETIGRAINVTEPDTWGVTAEITTRYEKPVPYDAPLLVTGKIIKNNRLFYVGEGSIILPDGEVAVTAKAKYIKMPLSKIADFDADGDAWRQYPTADDPAEIDIPEPGQHE